MTVYVIMIAKKLAYFINLSTTTKMQSFPCIMGNPMIKYMDILSLFYVGIISGYKNLGGWMFFTLFS